MKRMLIGALAIAATAAASQAAVVLTPTLSPDLRGSYYQFDIHLTGLTGADAQAGGTLNSASVGTVAGTFAPSIAGQAVISFPGTSSSYKSNSTSLSYGDTNSGTTVSTAPKSFVNLDTFLSSGAVRNPNLATTVNVSQLTGSWGNLSGDDTNRIYITDPNAGTASDEGIDQTLFGSVFVLKSYYDANPSATVNFNGTVGDFGSTSTPVSFALAVPEPASLGLLGLGALGLVARRRRA